MACRSSHLPDGCPASSRGGHLVVVDFCGGPADAHDHQKEDLQRPPSPECSDMRMIGINCVAVAKACGGIRLSGAISCAQAAAEKHSTARWG